MKMVQVNIWVPWYMAKRTVRTNEKMPKKFSHALYMMMLGIEKSYNIWRRVRGGPVDFKIPEVYDVAGRPTGFCENILDADIDLTTLNSSVEYRA